MEYTKKEVQEFLGSKATDNTRLINQLATKGITATTNGKRGVNLRFKCEQSFEEVGKYQNIIKGFARKREAHYILAFFEAQGMDCFVGTYQELATAIFLWSGEKVALRADNLGKAYRELVAADLAIDGKTQRLEGKKAMYLGGKKATPADLSNWFSTMEDKEAELLEEQNFLKDFDNATLQAWGTTNKELGSIRSVPYKEIKLDEILALL